MVHTTRWGFHTPQHMQQHPESMTAEDCELEDEEFFAWYAEEEQTRRVSPAARPTPKPSHRHLLRIMTSVWGRGRPPAAAVPV